MSVNLSDTGNKQHPATAAGAKYLLKRARRRTRDAVLNRPWIGFHRWKGLNNAPWDTAWDFGRWASFLLILPLIPIILVIWPVTILSSVLYILDGWGRREGILGIILFVISTSPVWYYFWVRGDDYGAGEPLAPSKREAWREKRARKAAKP